MSDMGFEPTTSGTAVRCANRKVIEATDNAQLSQAND